MIGNDDGINSIGIDALALAAKHWGNVDVVAPSSSYSSIYVILIIALLGFSLSGQVITSLVLVFLVFLSPIAVTAAPEQLRESMIVNSAVVLGGVAVLFFLRVEIALLYWVLILALVSHIALSYYRYGDLTALIPYYQVWLAATTSSIRTRPTAPT